MKRLKKGFTLAEVLITLAIIGVVAAIVVPSVMSNYQYKSIGVKLAKFSATVEAAARPFIVNNDNFSVTNPGEIDEDGKIKTASVSNITDFINESFIFKTFDPEVTSAGSNTKILTYPNVVTKKLTAEYKYEPQKGNANYPIAVLKDGTSIQVYLDDTPYANDHAEIVPVEKFGAPIFRINFDPRVQGLPASAQKNFNFTLTELGYMFPSENDPCTWQLYNEGFTTTSKSFETGKACHTGKSTN